MTSRSRLSRRSAALLCAVLAAALLAVAPVGGPAAAPDRPGATATLLADADGRLVFGRDGGELTFVGTRTGGGLDNPAVTPRTSVLAAARAHVARYGAALGADRPGTAVVAPRATRAVSGNTVVRYDQSVGGVSVLGGQLVVDLRPDREVGSLQASFSDAVSLPSATVTEAVARDTARVAAARSAQAGPAGLRVAPQGRRVFDPAVLGMPRGHGARGVWAFEVTGAAHVRRLVLVDDRTGGVLLDLDLVQHIDRVVCDGREVHGYQADCTAGFARTEADPVSAEHDVNAAFDLSGAVADFYDQIGGLDLTEMLGRDIDGVNKLASTVRYCTTNPADECPYPNAFWNGLQMTYGTGYAGADDVVGHEMTHGVIDRYSELFYWGQSGAINESLADVMGEILDHRHLSPGDAADSWSMGEDLPGYPRGIRDLADPAPFGHPDRTGSRYYWLDPTYLDNGGVHINSGVGNKAAHLISQGGTFNGVTVTGVDGADPTLTKTATLYLDVIQSLASGSKYADLGRVLVQSCTDLAVGGTAGFTTADCTEVAAAVAATEMADSPRNALQPPDASDACPTGTRKRLLFDSETGDAAAKFTAGRSWGRGEMPGWGSNASSGTDSWFSRPPQLHNSSSLRLASAVSLPAGQSSYLWFQHWRLLDYDATYFYDGGTVEIVQGGTTTDAAPLPWVNGPDQPLYFGNPEDGRHSFSGDSLGYLASRLDLSAFAGGTVTPQFTMNTDSTHTGIGWFLDDIRIYTCDVVANTVPPAITGTAQVGETLTASPGTWTPGDLTFDYQWFRDAAPVAGATTTTYPVTVDDLGSALSVRVTPVGEGLTGTAVSSDPTPAVVPGTIGHGSTSISGRAVVGSTLTVTTAGWRPDGLTFGYQWTRNGDSIEGATSPTYLLTEDDAGSSIRVLAYASRPGYASTLMGSSPVGPVLRATTAGLPTISGSPVEGESLTAHSGAWDPSDVSLEFSWLRDGVEIDAADAATYRLAAGDVGHRIAVAVTGSKAGHESVTVQSASTATVTRPAPPPAPDAVTAGTPTIEGEPVQGDVLTVRPGTWAPADVALAFAWQRDGEPIAGATGASYVLTAQDVGHTVGVLVTGTRAGYTPASRASAPVGPVLGLLTAGTPRVVGDAVEGGLLSVDPGTWGPGSPSLSYQWLRDDTPIAGATGSTYLLTAADRGHPIRVRVTGVRAGYRQAEATSDPTPPVLGRLEPAVPTVSGDAVVGGTLRVDPGAWGPAPVALSVQWLRDGAEIPGATGRRYELTEDDRGSRLSARVTGHKAGYASTSVESAATGPALGLLVAPRPKVAGVAAVGRVLRAVPGRWRPRGVTLAYQWLRAGEPIPGATERRYEVRPADRGERLRVRITGSRKGYLDATVVSGPTGLVR